MLEHNNIGETEGITSGKASTQHKTQNDRILNITLDRQTAVTDTTQLDKGSRL
jgi:hypothetical protein